MILTHVTDINGQFTNAYLYKILLWYRRAGKFGGGKVWRIVSFRAFGKRKFGKLIDQPIDN